MTAARRRFRDRQRRSGRREPFRDPLPKILVVCEGEATEPEYLRGFANACHNPRVDVVIAPEHGVPRTCVEVAKERKQQAAREADRKEDDNIAFDKVWCVIDVDDHPNLESALVMARDNNIDVALSNPNFELWILLHFRECPGMQHREHVHIMLCQYLAGYNKHIKYSDCATGYTVAVQRARRMQDAADEAGESTR